MLNVSILTFHIFSHLKRMSIFVIAYRPKDLADVFSTFLILNHNSRDVIEKVVSIIILTASASMSDVRIFS